jgi:hypothetical protein
MLIICLVSYCYYLTRYVVHDIEQKLNIHYLQSVFLYGWIMLMHSIIHLLRMWQFSVALENVSYIVYNFIRIDVIDLNKNTLKKETKHSSFQNFLLKLEDVCFYSYIRI